MRFPEMLFTAFVLLFVQLPAPKAQDVEPFKFFRDYVGLQDDQIAAIRKGKAVAKIVESKTSPPTSAPLRSRRADCLETGAETSVVA